VDEFGRQLKAELGKVSDDLAKMRQRKAELEEELRRYAEAIGSGGNMPALVDAMKNRQAELDAITNRLLSTQPDSIEAQLAEIREFVTSRITDLRGLLSKSVVLARAEVLKHVREIQMVPHVSESDPHYEAQGEWNLLGEDSGQNRQMGLVAGVGFEPTTSGL
ncbi:MAG TPA: hypothetical protein VNF27_01660, partial [Candidatus Binataceae bacterium]|nr:hypothetical protein [Candidatus Binataceae bacterium]